MAARKLIYFTDLVQNISNARDSNNHPCMKYELDIVIFFTSKSCSGSNSAII